MKNSAASDANIFHVSQSKDVFGRLVLNNPRSWRQISKLETKTLAARLADIEIGGWAIYWSQIYGYLADVLEKSPAVRAASILIPFEDLCTEPKLNVQNLFGHCGFPTKDHNINAAAGQVRNPTDYANSLADDEIALINLETFDTAKRLCH